MPPKKAQVDLWPDELRSALSGIHVDDNGIQQSWDAVLDRLPTFEEIMQVTFAPEGRALPYAFAFIAERLRPFVQLPVELVSRRSWETEAHSRKGTFRVIFRSRGVELAAPSQIFGIDCQKCVSLLKAARKRTGQKEIRDPDTGCTIATLDARHNTLQVHFCEVAHPTEDWGERHREIFASLVWRVIPLLPEPLLTPELWVQQNKASRREAVERVYRAYRVQAKTSQEGDLDELTRLTTSLAEVGVVSNLQAEVAQLQITVLGLTSLVKKQEEKIRSELEALLKRSDVASIHLWGSVLVCAVVKPDSAWTIVVNRAQIGDPVRWYKHEGSTRQAYAPSQYRMLIPLVELLSKGEWGTVITSAIAAISTSRLQPIHLQEE